MEKSRQTMHRFWRSWGLRRGCGAIWYGTLSDTLAGVAARDHRIGCEKRLSWGCASSSRGRRKCVGVLL